MRLSQIGQGSVPVKDAFEGSNTEVSKANSEAVVQERKVEGGL